MSDKNKETIHNSVTGETHTNGDVMEIKETAKKIKCEVHKVLQYLRINDEKNVLSLTNIAMILILYKVAITPTVSFQDITALFIAIAGYQTKRIVNK